MKKISIIIVSFLFLLGCQQEGVQPTDQEQGQAGDKVEIEQSKDDQVDEAEAEKEAEAEVEAEKEEKEESSDKAQAEKEESDQDKSKEESSESDKADQDLEEFAKVEEVIKQAITDYKVVEDNQQKRVMIIMDDKGHEAYKTIYLKKKNRLKVIEFNHGEIFSDII